MNRKPQIIEASKGARRFPARFVSMVVAVVVTAVPSTGNAADATAEVLELAAASPEAAAQVAQAEQAIAAGNLKVAWESFGRAWPLARRSPLPSRGICRLALTLGIATTAQRTAALSACQSALTLGGTAEDMRNRAAAWVTGTIPPSMEELVSASFAADGAVRTCNGQPWGGLAWGAIALRLGDRGLLDASISEVRNGSPEQETTRYMSLLQADKISWATRLGRWAMVLFLMVTLAHVLLRARFRRWRARAAIVGGAALVLLSLVARTAGASPTADSPSAIADKMKTVTDPLMLAEKLLELPAQAEAATQRGDHAAAARMWAAVTEAVPERTYGFARLCESLEASGDWERAVVACRTALTRQGTTAGDYTHFVQLLLGKNGQLSSEERRQIGVAIVQLDKEPRAALIAERVRCDVAVHDADRSALAACTAKLQAAAPADWRTASFSWELARLSKDQAGVTAWRDKAQGLGAPAHVVERMGGGRGASHRVIRGVRWGLSVALVLGVVALAYAAAVKFRRQPLSR